MARARWSIFVPPKALGRELDRIEVLDLLIEGAASWHAQNNSNVDRVVSSQDGFDFSMSMDIGMDIILEASMGSDGEVVDRRGGGILRLEGLHKEAVIGKLVAEGCHEGFASLVGI